MASLLLNMNIKVIEVDEIMNIGKCAIDLVDQIELSDFTDKSGHKLIMNDSYIKLRESIHKFNELLEKCNNYEFVDMSK